MKPTKQQTRQDETGLTIKVTSFGGKFWCVRKLRNGKPDGEGAVVYRKQHIGAMVSDMLRWENKLGGRSPMASASRDRRGKPGKGPTIEELLRKEKQCP